MNVPIIISGGGIIGNYISLRLKRHNIESLIIEKSSETQDYSPGIRTLTLNNHSLSLLQKEKIDLIPFISLILLIDNNVSMLGLFVRLNRLKNKNASMLRLFI